MKNFYFILLLIVQISFSQAPTIEWQKALGGTNSDIARSIQKTTDGGYIVTGESSSNDGDVTGNHGNFDYWIIKLTSMGIIQWQKTLGGTVDEDAYSIQQTADGGYIIAGFTSSINGDVSGNHGNNDYWIVKLSSTGNIEWQKTLGGTGLDIAQSIRQTADEGYIVAGCTQSNDGDVAGNHGSYDYWIVKLSNTGSIQWQKTLGGAGNDYAYSIEQTADEGYIVAGYTSSNNGDVTGFHGFEDYWVVKLTSTGTIEWQKTLGGTGFDQAYSIKQTADGGYVIAGYSDSYDGDVTGNHGYDYWIVKLTSTGIIEWQKTIGGTGTDYARSVEQTTDGGYIVAGYAESINGDVTGNHGSYDYWVIRLSNTGVIQWQKTLGGNGVDFANSIQQTTDGGYIVAGYSNSTNQDVTGNHGSRDYWVVKLAPDALGTNTFVANSLKIFPNPTSSSLIIQVSANLVFDKMIVTDLTGKAVLEQEQSSNQINVEKLSGGMYILQAFVGEETFVSKFVKE